MMNTNRSISLQRKHRRTKRKRAGTIVHVNIRSSSISCNKTKNTTSTSDYSDQIPWEKSTDKKNLVNDYHRKLRKPNQKRYAYLYAFISLCLLIALLIAIIVIIRISARQNRKYKDRTAVLRWNTSGITVANQLKTPTDLVVDYMNTLYVIEWGNYRVQKFLNRSLVGTTVAGQSNGTSGSSPAHLASCYSFYLDSSYNLYISDTMNHRVQFWANNSLVGIMIMGTGSAGGTVNELRRPHGLDYDESKDTFYLADGDNHRIMSYPYKNSTGIVITGGNGVGTGRNQLNIPHAVFYDSITKSVLIANAAANNVVRSRSDSRNWTLVAGDINGNSGSLSTQFKFPSDVMLDPMGNIYVTDRENHRVQFFSSDQITGQTIMGTTGISGSNSTLLRNPCSMTLDSQLNLYVADMSNGRVQKYLRY